METERLEEQWKVSKEALAFENEGEWLAKEKRRDSVKRDTVGCMAHN